MGRHSIPEPGESGDEPVDDRSNVDSGEHHVDVGDSGRSGAGSPPRPGNTPYPRYVAHPSDDPDEFPTIRGYADDDDSSYPDEGPDPDEDDSPDDDPGIARGPMRPPFALSRGGRSGVGGQWRGGHRNDGGHRGVSIGVIAALVTVVVVVGAVIAWRFFGDALSHRSRAAAARCLDGNETVAVIADPSIAEPVQRFADQYNRSATPVGDHCVTVNVKSADSEAVVNGFAADWPRDLGARPALWIPGSSVSAARLRATAGPQAISDSRSLATSPVLLAVRPELQRVLGGQSWATLPGLQSKPDGLTGVKLAAWGSMRLALPLSGNGDAAFLAAEAVAAASAPPGAPPTAGRAAVRTLIDAQPKLADKSLTEAMNVLLRPGDPAIAPVHAVVTTEQQLFQRGESLSDANSALASWLPPGPAAVADYPMVLLSGSWLSQEQVTAASAFARFMHKPDQLAELATAGFRAAGTSLPSSDVTSFAALPPALSVGDDAMRASLAKTLAAPATGLAASIVLDQSMTPDEGGKTRLANVVAALDNRIRALPPNSVVALWTFDGTEGRPEVPSGPLADPVDGQPRSAALTAALNNQYPSASGAVSFTTLRLVYQEAQANFRAGRANSVLVITAGAHTDQSLDGSGLQDFLRRSVDPARPVMINVIDFGADPDRATWEAVAQISGGSYQNLATSASPELATAVDTVLS